MAPTGSGGIVGVVLGAVVAALPHIGAFNVHPVPYRVLTHGGSRSFGHQVLQLHGARLVVGAPAEAGEGGRLFQCDVESGDCREVEMEGNATHAHMGMALARDGDTTIACGPGFTRECDRNVYTSGVCLVLDPQLKPQRLLTPGYQGCLPGMVDLVFLFDGSNSMNAEQFGAIRDFMVDVMEKLGNTSIRFGAVQFSDRVKAEFTLADYAARPRPRELLGALRQLRSLTDTFAAIAYVTQTIFTPERGARAGAKRVLIIITDGDATDEDRGAVAEAEERGIARYVIGVGNNFNSPDTRLYLSQFASRPSSDFVKVLESFEKLRGLFRELQAKIYDIEGTGALNRFHLELCSSGMSVAAAHGRRVTGAVGADNWAGGLVELEEGTFVASPASEEDGEDAYLGYAVAGLRVPGRPLVAAGAPRHRHVGAVVLFELPQDTGSWRVLQTLPGEQVGSYFGATLCAVDQGGETVALLVGAPGHYDGRHGGRVHVYGWQKDSLVPAGALRGAPGHPLGAFGASAASLGDLDGDGLADVAIGAPLEDDAAGAVYVFAGRRRGVASAYSQRLAGRAAAAARFFGRAVAGGAVDVTGDGLADVAVGAEGMAVVPPRALRDAPRDRRPRPHPLPPCPPVRLRLCLLPRLESPAPAGDLVTPIDFRLEVEPHRARGRGDFGAGQRLWAGQLRARAGQERCEEAELTIPPSLDDLVTPLRVAVTVSLPHSDAPGPILRPDIAPTWFEIPFQKNCGADDVCEADLGVRAAPGEGALLGVPGAVLGVRVLVANGGEDAYGAALQVRHPAGLSLRRARASQAAAPVPITCWEAEVSVGQLWGLTCNLSRPVLRAGWQVTAELTFDVLPNASWGDAVGLAAAVSSENEPPGTLGDNAVAWAVPVRVALDLVATWDDASTRYLNFTARRADAKTLLHRYRIEALRPPPHGGPPPLLTAFVLLPHTLPHGVRVVDPQVRVEPGGACVAVGQEEVDAVGQELRENIAKACSTAELRPFRCPPTPLPLLLLLGAALLPPPIQRHARPRFCSALWAAPAPPRYEAPPCRAQGLTEVELLHEADAHAVYVGGGAGGLLLLLGLALALAKCGFFRRSYRERLGGAGPEGAGPEGEGPEGAGPEGEGGDPQGGEPLQGAPPPPP